MVPTVAGSLSKQVVELERRRVLSSLPYRDLESVQNERAPQSLVREVIRRRASGRGREAQHDNRGTGAFLQLVERANFSLAPCSAAREALEQAASSHEVAEE